MISTHPTLSTSTNAPCSNIGSRSRFGILQVIVSVVGAMALLAVSLVPVSANHDVGPEEVYFPETGQYLTYNFLDFWRHEGGIPIFGYPVTGAFDEDGRIVQYFERAVFEWYPDNPQGWQVLLRHLGVDAAGERSGERPFQPIEHGETAGAHRFFPETGHYVSHGFRDFWEANGNLNVFGYPLSEEFTEDGMTVQYFERAVFEWHPDNPQGWRVQLRHLGITEANSLGVDRSPQPHDESIPIYDRGLWSSLDPEPTVMDPLEGRVPYAAAPSDQAQWIEVELSTQRLRAWEYDTLVFEALVSTGLPDTPTIPGTFQTFWHLPAHDMTGGRAGTADYYYLPDVPWVMYYQEGGYAIHGTYWHNNFGTPMSHGCVNMTISDAEWLYSWAYVGITVWIH